MCVDMARMHLCFRFYYSGLHKAEQEIQGAILQLSKMFSFL